MWWCSRHTTYYKSQRADHVSQFLYTENGDKQKIKSFACLQSHLVVHANNSPIGWATRQTQQGFYQSGFLLFILRSVQRKEEVHNEAS